MSDKKQIKEIQKKETIRSRNQRRNKIFITSKDIEEKPERNARELNTFSAK